MPVGGPFRLGAWLIEIFIRLVRSGHLKASIDQSKFVAD
jgi:hypothetical protein